MDKYRLKASKPLSSGGITNCITQHGEWRVPNATNSQIAKILEQDTTTVKGKVFLKCETTDGIQGYILADRLRFYNPDGRYSGMRLKRLHEKAKK
jgi:hypothetical protein